MTLQVLPLETRRHPGCIEKMARVQHGALVSLRLFSVRGHYSQIEEQQLESELTSRAVAWQDGFVEGYKTALNEVREARS